MKKNKKKILTALGVILLMAAGFAGLYTYLTKYGDINENRQRSRLDKQNAINGHWESKDGITVDIWRDEKDVFHALVSQSNGDDTVYFWEMSGEWTGDTKGFSYTDGLKSKVVYNAKGEEKTTIKYDQGEGRFRLKGDRLYWDDDEEHTAKGDAFSYVGEY